MRVEGKRDGTCGRRGGGGGGVLFFFLFFSPPRVAVLRSRDPDLGVHALSLLLPLSVSAVQWNRERMCRQRERERSPLSSVRRSDDIQQEGEREKRERREKERGSVSTPDVGNGGRERENSPFCPIRAVWDRLGLMERSECRSRGGRRGGGGGGQNWDLIEIANSRHRTNVGRRGGGEEEPNLPLLFLLSLSLSLSLSRSSELTKRRRGTKELRRRKREGARGRSKRKRGFLRDSNAE